MTTTTLEQIEQIISRSRCGDEMFFTDCKGAAKEILDLMEAERAKVIPINVELNKCMVI